MQHIYLFIEAGYVINMSHVVAADFAKDYSSVMLYLIAPARDGQTVRITDATVIANAATCLDVRIN